MDVCTATNIQGILEDKQLVAFQKIHTSVIKKKVHSTHPQITTSRCDYAAIKGS
jgi:hypothetical protein